MVKYAGSMFLQTMGTCPPICTVRTSKVSLSSGFDFYTLQCFSGVISLWMSVAFHPCLYSVC